MKRSTHLFVLGVLVSLLGCGSGPTEVKEFPTNCWKLADPLVAEVALSPEASRILLDLQLGQDYPYQNLYLKLSWKGPDGAADTLVNDTLITPEGVWLVNPSGGKVNWTFQDGISLPIRQAGTYQIRVEHFMRDDRLCEIDRIALRLGS